VQCYTDVDVGTLYYAIRQLAKARLIKAVARERVARGGVRTVYAITPAGRQRFQELLHACFAAPGTVPETLYGALLFLHLADLGRVAGLLAARIELQAEAIRKVTEVRRELGPFMASGGLHLLEHIDAQRRLDQSWLKTLLAEVLAGKVHDVPDPRRLADTDEQPPGARKRAKRKSS
jgi:DNA-binding PadR family transcriptional regulator